MPRDPFPHVSVTTRFWIWFRLAYKEAQYWLVGLTPESYHLHQAGLWADLNAYSRAISHLKRYLAITENVTARSELAFYHSCIGEWSQAASEYARVVPAWPHPAILLAQAEAELRLGNTARGHQIIADVDRDFPALDIVTRRARDELTAEFRLGAEQ